MTDMLCSHEFTRSITSGCLEGLFSKYGTILSSKVAEENGKSKGFGFVRFDSEKPTAAALLESSFKGKTINRDSNNILCFETEKQALLSFKQDLIDPRLLTWVAGEEDFCKWDGIVCDNIIGHVQELRPAADFGDTQIPRFISSLVSLRYLNLTSAGFAGNEPPPVRKPLRFAPSWPWL